jgi:hypothetical protein
MVVWDKFKYCTLFALKKGRELVSRLLRIDSLQKLLTVEQQAYTVMGNNSTNTGINKTNNYLSP